MSDDGWTWELAAKAQDTLDALSPDEQGRILDELDEVVTFRGVSRPSTVNRSPVARTGRYVSARSDSRCRSGGTTGGYSSPGSSRRGDAYSADDD